MASYVERPGEFRDALRAWLAGNPEELEPFRGTKAGTFEEDVELQLTLQRLLYDTEWGRWGWPEDCGGLGESLVLRGILYDELIRAGIAYPHFHEAFELMASMLLRYSPDIARIHIPLALRGEEVWTQTFSEPNAGSDMASITTRAVEEGDTFRVNGQKVWQSFGHMASWTMLLARTGTPESRHKGLSMFWVDMASPGITARPIKVANGRNELAEVFFDDVVVPRSGLIGEVGEGWSVAMYVLQFERGMYAWQRQGHLHMRLNDALRRRTRPAAEVASAVADVYVLLFALRMRARATLHRLAAGELLGPETSIDKTLLSTTEQAVYDVIRQLVWPDLEIGDDDAAEIWRDEWFYSRATSIFGGAVEVQRDIIAERVLGLPRRR